MTPKGSNLVLTTDIPDGERDILVFDCLDVEADSRDGGYDLTKLELIHYATSANCVESLRVVTSRVCTYGLWFYQRRPNRP